MTVRQDNHRILYIIILIIFVSANVILAFYHEAWRDEAQAWVLVKNNSISGIISLLPTEGHPALWFTILYPFTRLGFSFYYFSCISLVIISISSALFIFCTDFPIAIKTLFIFSSAFFYYNAVICRIYSVVVLLIVLLMSVWKRRNDTYWYGILVFLIFQSHILLSGLAIGCIFDLLIYIIVNLRTHQINLRKAVVSLAVAFSGLVLLILELKQKSDTETFIKFSLLSFFRQISFTGIKNGIGSLFHSFKYGFIILMLFAIICFAYFVYLLIKHQYYKALRALFLYSSAFGVYFMIICFVRQSGHPQMSICGFLIFMFVMYDIYLNNSAWNVRLILYLMIIAASLYSMFYTFKDAKYDLNGIFSNGKEMAMYIEENLQPEDMIIVPNSARIPLVYAYVTSNTDSPTFIDETDGKEFCFHKWGHDYIPEKQLSDIVRGIDTHNDSGNVYYLTDNKVDDTQYSIKLLKECNVDTPYGESFYLYYVDDEAIDKQ